MIRQDADKLTIREGEAWDDLQTRGLMILQDRNAYCFSSDATLLANFAVHEGIHGKTCELCAGSGVIGQLVVAKSGVRQLDMIELQEPLARRAALSAKRNGLEGITVWQGDAHDCAELGAYAYDNVLVNPPYFRVGEGQMSEEPQVAMCRHETHLTLAALVNACDKLLKYGGKLWMVYTASRLAELISLLRGKGLEPKVLINVAPTDGKPVDTVLMLAKKGAKVGLTVYNETRRALEERYYEVD